MFEVKSEFVGMAYGHEISTPRLYWVLKDVFEYLTEYYEDINFDEQALCTDLLDAIRRSHVYADYPLYIIEDALISCVDKEVPIRELRLHVYDDTRYFDALNDNFANNTYLIKE